MKKVFKWVAIIILTPIILFLVLAFLLYLPPVQNWAADKVAAYASEKTGMDISVGHVSLKFPLDLAIDDFKLIKPNDSIPGVRDTIADIGQLVVDIQLMPLFKSQVEIDEFQLNKAKINTNGFIADFRLQGDIEKLSLQSHGINLKKTMANVNNIQFDNAQLHVFLPDSVPPDTTVNHWKVHIDDLKFANSNIAVHMPGDTLEMNIGLADAIAKGTDVDLSTTTFKIGHLESRQGLFTYDNKFVNPVSGLDANHISMTEMNIVVDSISLSSPNVDLNLRHCSFKEKSGLTVNDFSGIVSMDSTRLSVPAFSMKTPDSNLSAKVEMDLNAFDDFNPGKVYADVDGYLGKQDLMRFMGDMPQDFVRKWPNQPLTIRGRMRGNMQRADLSGVYVSLPTAFNLNASGYVENMTKPSALKADLKLKGKTDNLDFVTTMLPPEVNREVKIPRGIGIDGTFKANGPVYGADFIATEGGGTLKANLALDSKRMKYSTTIDAKNFPLQHFLPNMGLSPISAYLEADGEGTDIMSKATSLRANARIEHFKYGGYSFDGMKATALVKNGRIDADIDSRSRLLDGRVSFDALISSNKLQGTFSCDLNNADLYQLRLADKPLTVSGCAHVDIDSDFKDYYKVKGSLSGASLYFDNKLYNPDYLDIDLLTRKDTTYAYVNSGDFQMNLNGKGGYEKLLKEVEGFTNELSKQLKDKHFNQERLQAKLPNAKIYLDSGSDNFFANLLQEQGVSFDHIQVDMESSRQSGINGNLYVKSLAKDSILLDDVKFAIVTDSTGINYNGQVYNGPDNPFYAFNAILDGSFMEHGAKINAKVYDKDDKLGLDVGAVASIESNGVRVNLVDTKPVIGYMPFTANEDNYIFLSDDNRVSAKLSLKSDDGTSLQVYTNDDNFDALQDLTVSVHQLDLGRLMSTLPFLPNVKGELEGDFHIVQTEADMTVSSAMNIKSLFYEDLAMGDIGAEFVYMPNEDGSHYVDGIFSSDGKEVGSLVGTYNPTGNGSLDADMHLESLPLTLINGFMPDQMIAFKGTTNGDLTVKGPLSKLDINGELAFHDASVYSVPYGFSFNTVKHNPSSAEDAAPPKLRIVGSNLLFEDFKLYDRNDTPLTIRGNYDFSCFDKMNVNLRLMARNFQIINARENIKSEAYGKAYVNLGASITGPVDMLEMRGRLDVLGSTDMTYVLRDSPLTADTRMEELVRFVDFNDSIEHVVRRPAPSGFKMNMTIHIDQDAHIICDLKPDHSNYIDLIGGGDLRMQYDVVDNLRLTGRYTLSNGEMKYSLPIIPLKTFTIQDGSYIEFRGDPMNPVLNITATEQRKASVEDESGGTRSVNFDCGVVITQTLNDMGLEFIINAPEDMSLSSELATMTTEERSKVAVTMLTTGMYLSDGNTGGFSMNGALSSFLQSEINNITGNALRTLDFTVGVDNATDASGSMYTDYSFKFAKRFWNNRLRVVVGGKVSTGSEMENQNQSFFTNVTFEYRLSTTSNKYLKVFYDRDSYDWFEGEIGEYGAGFLWRRKLQHFNEIFKFKNDDNNRMPPRQNKDSTSLSSPYSRPMNIPSRSQSDSIPKVERQ